VIFVAADESFALVGDVVFAGSIGRTDLPGGNMDTLMGSIREQVLTLPDETELFTGHGPPTTVGQERRTNPFLVPHYGGGLV
jgi:glyoxylase-like metal-dependent hydrolase (beta-lactamase superfamily II)